MGCFSSPSSGQYDIYFEELEGDEEGQVGNLGNDPMRVKTKATFFSFLFLPLFFSDCRKPIKL